MQSVPNKGRTLTSISCFWFDQLKTIIPNHLITSNIDEMPESVLEYRDQLEGRSMLVKKLQILPVEAIIRGYITGSGWKEYMKKGSVCEIVLPKGLRECEKLPEPLFTPSTKAEIGGHDENIHPAKLAAIIGIDRAKEVEAAAIKIFNKASELALEKGIIIADTKFEFGIDDDGVLHLADEVLTPGRLDSNTSTRFFEILVRCGVYCRTTAI
ncbi:MAG: phosphoribosylaminoimidazole-succinocarboxamide synthase [Flammeovirgaceae bacterium]|jgi:phosphoribosylaminoimidazole-succinocarboxamide synthase